MRQTATVRSAMLAGLDVTPLTIDVDITPGPPQLTLVGVGDIVAHEAISRVRCAFKASGFEVPRQRVVVQVSPAEARPRGTQLDLAIAVAILVASQQVTVPLDDPLLVGELSLDGRVLPVRGLACYSDYCTDHGLTLLCPKSSDHISHVPLDTLGGLPAVDWSRRTTSRLTPVHPQLQCLSEALRAVIRACLGTNRVLLLRSADGPVSSSVIALQRSIPTLTQGQCDEARRIHSACSAPFEGEPPFRCPHHAISQAGMVGGGRPVLPGEVTLASHGLLLLSDIERFDRGVLASLRVALRDREVRVVRVEGTWHMPAVPSLTVTTTRDTKTPAERLLGPIAGLGFEEVRL